MLRGIPLFVTAGIILATTLIQADTMVLAVFGVAFLVGAYKMYDQKRIDFRKDIMSSSGIATIILFLSLVLFGIMYIWGTFQLPVIGLEVTKELAQYAMAIVILLGYVDANFKRR